MTKRFDYEIGDFVADKFGNVYKVLDIDDYERIPVKVKIVERKTETYFCGCEPASSRDEAWLFDKNFAFDVVDAAEGGGVDAGLGVHHAAQGVPDGVGVGGGEGRHA